MDQANEVRSPKASLPIGEGASGSHGNSEIPDDLKPAARDDFARQEPRRGRKLRTVFGAAAVLGGGWVIGLNSQFDMAQGRVWFDEGAIKLSSALASVQRGIVDRLEHRTGRDVPATNTIIEKPNYADALERVAGNLSIKIDLMRVSSEALTRNISSEVERLRGSMESSHGDLVTKFAQFGERLERLERQTQPLATPATEHTGAISPTLPTPPPVQRLATEPPKVTPPAQTELRREPTVIKRWRVREVLNGTALLEGPEGLIGVSRGQMVPGVGRVESILRAGNRWVVATSKGVITSN